VTADQEHRPVLHVVVAHDRLMGVRYCTAAGWPSPARATGTQEPGLVVTRNSGSMRGRLGPVELHYVLPYGGRSDGWVRRTERQALELNAAADPYRCDRCSATLELHHMDDLCPSGGDWHHWVPSS